MRALDRLGGRVSWCPMQPGHRSMRDAVGTIRRLVYDLRPPALDDLGLVAAIRDRAAHYGRHPGGTGGVEVTVAAPDHLPPLPAAVEVAAYRIVQEALMNVVKHAQARSCHVRLVAADALQVEVADDGIGLGDSPTAGVGLRSMHDRAEELGGSCVIERAIAGGTRVVVRLPIRHEASDEPAPRLDR